MTAAERIKAIRSSLGLTQVAFAARYGIPRRTVEDWERGLREPPEYVITMIDKLTEADVEAAPAKGEERDKK